MEDMPQFQKVYTPVSFTFTSVEPMQGLTILTSSKMTKDERKRTRRIYNNYPTLKDWLTKNANPKTLAKKMDRNAVLFLLSNPKLYKRKLRIIKYSQHGRPAKQME
jgi:hypothetical protein